MKRRPRGAVALASLSAGILGASLLAVVPAASATPSNVGAPVALNDNGPIAADAGASLLTLDIAGLSPSILPQTNIDLGASAAAAASDQDLDADKDGGQRSAAVGSLVFNSFLLGQDLAEALDGLINNNSASAPESEALDAELLALPLDPLLTLPVINSHVEANWESDVECVAAETPMSLANQTAADVTLLDVEGFGSVLELTPAEGEGAADTEVSTWLVEIDGPGDARAVQARASTGISNATLLDGIIDIDVVETPVYIAQASGLPGGAAVTPPSAEVTISAGGMELISLGSLNSSQSATITGLTLGSLINMDGSLLADLLGDLGLPGPVLEEIEGFETEIQNLLAALQPVVQASIPFESTAASDGTSASFSGSLLRLEILPPTVIGEIDPDSPLAPLAAALNLIGVSLVDQLLQPLLDALGADLGESLLELNLAPVSGSVQAPSGGIDCTPPEIDNPLRELNKHATATEVAPGGIFEYNISVPNRGPCALTDVVVGDSVEGPGQIIATEPEATTVDGNQATWEIGDLAVNETVNLTITVQVDEDAPDGATFDDFVIATGNCDGREVQQPDAVEDIPRVVDDFEGPCSVQFSNKDASHEQVTVGQTFSYYVHAFNTGAEPCTDVVITDTLDDRVSFVSCNKGCDNQGQTVTWTLDSIPSGSSVVLSVVVQVNEGASGELGNTAVIDPGNGDPKTVTTTGPIIGNASIPKDPLPAARILGGAMPRTGAAIPAGLALLAGLGAYGLWALRRRSASV